MKFPILFVYTHILSIILLAHNALGSPMQKKRISNGYSDKTNIFKHEARLLTRSRLCTGAIITNLHILTAAHCVVQLGTNDAIMELMEVTVGITEIDNQYEYQTVRLVETIYTPTHYVAPFESSPGEDLKNNIGDIAVLKLNYGLGIGLDPRIEALNIPDMEYQPFGNTVSNKLIFTGFGGINAVYNPNINDYQPGEYPKYLQYSSVQSLPSEACPWLGNNQLKMCAELANPIAGFCSGDSGGPLFNEDKIIYGVVSYGSATCGHEPEVFTKVFPYVGFIENAVEDNLYDTTIQRHTYKDEPVYQKHLKENSYLYHNMYVPTYDVLKTSQKDIIETLHNNTLIKMFRSSYFGQ